MAELASREASMVVKKRDVSSFRDLELAAFIQEYRTLMGRKTQDTTRKVGTGVTHCLLLGLLQWAWETWVYLLSDFWHNKAKRNKKYQIIKTVNALLHSITQRVWCTLHFVKQSVVYCVICQNQLPSK